MSKKILVSEGELKRLGTGDHFDSLAERFSSNPGITASFLFGLSVAAEIAARGDVEEFPLVHADDDGSFFPAKPTGDVEADTRKRIESALLLLAAYLERGEIKGVELV